MTGVQTCALPICKPGKGVLATGALDGALSSSGGISRGNAQPEGEDRQDNDDGILALGALENAAQSDLSSDGSSSKASAKHDSKANSGVKTKRMDVQADTQSSNSVEAGASTQR